MHHLRTCTPQLHGFTRRSIHNGMKLNGMGVQSQKLVSLTFVIPNPSGFETRRKVRAAVGSSLSDIARHHDISIHDQQAQMQIQTSHDGMHLVVPPASRHDRHVHGQPASLDPRIQMLQQVVSEQQRSLIKLEVELQETAKQVIHLKKTESTRNEKERDDSSEQLKLDLAQTKVVIKSCDGAVRFDDVIGLENAKRAVRESVLWPAVAQSGLFSGIRSAAKGLLLYGPPGCGKTMLARAAAHELHGTATFFYVRPGDLMNKYYGETQKRVQALAEVVKEARPAVVFFDEVDSLLGHRSASEGSQHHQATTNALLEWMDGFARDSENVFFLAATNRPEAIDEAALRRFGMFAEVETPTAEARLALIYDLVGKARTMNQHDSLSSDDLKLMAEQLQGFSLANVESLVRQAYLEVLRELDPAEVPKMLSDQVPSVTIHHFEKARLQVQSSSAAHEFFQNRRNNI